MQGPVIPPPRKLYHLKSDIEETNNVVSQYPEKVATFERLLEREKEAGYLGIVKWVNITNGSLRKIRISYKGSLIYEYLIILFTPIYM